MSTNRPSFGLPWIFALPWGSRQHVAGAFAAVRQIALALALVLVCLQSALPALRAAELTGWVVGIQDGDTLTVRLEDGPVWRIRLWGIDAPERRQAYSNAARKYLAALAFRRQVRVLVRDQDRYGRIVAEVRLSDGVNLNQEMVRAGYAWWFRRYAPYSRVLARLEKEAREARRGLWADPDPQPPWEYRRAR